LHVVAAAAAPRDTKLAPADREQLARQYAGRAVEWLRQAVAKGFKGPADVGRLQSDHDLDPLRDRDDFRALLAGLDKEPPK
jgi:hypothetical protein